jgi:outer membrane protein OmpA-like peptidoglycan-associated protein
MLNKTFENIIFVIIVSILGSCTSLESLNRTPLKGDRFQNNLVEHYKKLAQKEAKVFNWSDYQHFIDKAFAATKGLNPLPENLSYWKIPQTKLTEFIVARKKLLSLLYTHKLKDNHPELAAKAQYNFDCWVEEQDKAWRPDSTYECREYFYKSIYQLSNLIRPSYNLTAIKSASKKIATKPIQNTNIDKKLATEKPEKIVEKPKPQTKLETVVTSKKPTTSPVKSTAKKYVFSMKNNDAKLDQKQKATLSHIASYLALNPEYNLNILSYNNSKISDTEKMMIAKYRAQIVKDILKKQGVKNNRITSYSFASLTSMQIENELVSYGENVLNIVIGE